MPQDMLGLAPVALAMRWRWFWRCPACDIPQQPCQRTDARQLAEEHDAQHHKGRPLTAFGFERLSPDQDDR